MKHTTWRPRNHKNRETFLEYFLLAAFATTVAAAIVLWDPFGFRGPLIDAFETAMKFIRGT